jgi:hypothetical protein
LWLLVAPFNLKCPQFATTILNQINLLLRLVAPEILIHECILKIVLLASLTYNPVLPKHSCIVALRKRSVVVQQ